MRENLDFFVFIWLLMCLIGWWIVCVGIKYSSVFIETNTYSGDDDRLDSEPIILNTTTLRVSILSVHVYYRMS